MKMARAFIWALFILLIGTGLTACAEYDGYYGGSYSDGSPYYYRDYDYGGPGVTIYGYRDYDGWRRPYYRRDYDRDDAHRRWESHDRDRGTFNFNFNEKHFTTRPGFKDHDDFRGREFHHDRDRGGFNRGRTTMNAPMRPDGHMHD
ncbi:MAG: hypothetical protein ACLGPL_04500 [Acidobacteriota bacterium]